MTYAVHHVDAEGATQLDDVVSLQEALTLVERLRNDGAVSQVRVLKEVPIEVRTYYRVVAVEEEEGEAAAAAPAAEALAEFDAVSPAEVDAHPAAVPEPPRAVPVPGEPPSGAVVMGPPPAAAPEAGEAAAEPAPEPRRALFSRG